GTSRRQRLSTARPRISLKLVPSSFFLKELPRPAQTGIHENGPIDRQIKRAEKEHANKITHPIVAKAGVMQPNGNRGWNCRPERHGAEKRKIGWPCERSDEHRNEKRDKGQQLENGREAFEEKVVRHSHQSHRPVARSAQHAAIVPDGFERNTLPPRALADETACGARTLGLRNHVRQRDDAIRATLPSESLVNPERHFDVLARKRRREPACLENHVATPQTKRSRDAEHAGQARPGRAIRDEGP